MLRITIHCKFVVIECACMGRHLPDFRRRVTCLLHLLLFYRFGLFQIRTHFNFESVRTRFVNVEYETHFFDIRRRIATLCFVNKPYADLLYAYYFAADDNTQSQVELALAWNCIEVARQDIFSMEARLSWQVR